ncbi:MAG TPA: hypothetical protein VHO24_07820 [Opitutaceae bacterium]|nr:hypothetical protein [Opitutaceae bacterium]
MKSIRTLVLLLFISGCVFAAEPAIEFRGVMAGSGATKLSLRDKATDTTRWLEVGQTFAGYKISGYDASKEIATLTKDGVDLRLRLNASQVKEAGPDSSAAPAKSKEEITRGVLNNLRQISAAADQYFLETGKTSVTLTELVGPTKYIRRLVPLDGESYDGLQLKQGAGPLTISTVQGVSVSYAP